MSDGKKILPEGVSFICIEGPIGVGKTEFTRKLSAELDARTVFEEAEENPFLLQFYDEPGKFAFQTQLWFLLSRYRQIEETFTQESLFHQVTVSDYMFSKDRIFASVNLSEDEMALYDSVENILSKKVVNPDLIIYLQSTTDVLMKRIKKRGRHYEKSVGREYIDCINQTYNHFFFHYKDAPVLIVNTSDIDFVNEPDDFRAITDQLAGIKTGINYYNPLGKSGRAEKE